MYQIVTHRVSPFVGAVILILVSESPVLIEEVILPIIEDKAVWIFDVMSRSREMELRSIPLGVITLT